MPGAVQVRPAHPAREDVDDDLPRTGLRVGDLHDPDPAVLHEDAAHQRPAGVDPQRAHVVSSTGPTLLGISSLLPEDVVAFRANQVRRAQA
ncbi:hypothetical protein Acsp07_10160 [Actinomycetospora sp. NBRC 106378]|nr:hypothetical protein Acsp07_10160 [Actinomycetospora sp. NBRC 106378]